MKPRLVSSKKWTAFPAEFSQQIADVFKQSFQDEFAKENLKVAKIIVDGRIYPEEINLRVGFLEEGRLKQANFEISVNIAGADEKTLDSIHTCIDAAGSMMQEYIAKDGMVEFPYTWTEDKINGARIWHQYSTENNDLEAEANRLLGLEPTGLVLESGDEDSDEALDRAEILAQDELEKERAAFLAKSKAANKDELH